MSIIDKPQVVDLVSVVIETDFTRPVYPCPKCNSETKIYKKTNLRICSNKKCRSIIDLGE